jgi:apolipoprotein N-acyltransferase
MAILRAVENVFALARSARYGHLTLNDNRGRILAETASAFGRFASITGTVNIVRETTFYTRFGDWFALISVTVFVILYSYLAFSRADITRLIPHPVMSCATGVVRKGAIPIHLFIFREHV